jgi:phospholipase C
MANPLSQIKHIVVLMFENRSFDNMLGALYPEGTPNFDGVWNTKKPNVFHGKEFWPAHGSDMIQPFPDPNEEYQFVYRQMFDDFMSYWPPADPPEPASMSGFVTDYSLVQPVDGKAPVLQNIMNHFQPEDVPVISQLAKAYAVCDHWFCSIPSQTNCNRSFAAAGTSSGWVNNSDGLIPFINATETIFNLLGSDGSWRVYSAGGAWEVSNTYAFQAQLWWETKHFFDLDQFYCDIQDETTFPSYTFLEPNYMWQVGPPVRAENDEHPESGNVNVPGHPSNVLLGEALLFNIFTALTKSPGWDSTLFIVTFDEHGGTFDHAVPPSAVSPDGIVIPKGQLGYSGFPFDRLGVRVPAVVISPLIEAGTISNTVYDHTSIIKTVINTFGMNTTLLKREEQANDLSGVVNRTTPRTDIPQITPRPTPLTTPEMAARFADVPLNGLQKSMMLALMRVVQERAPAAAAAVVEPPEAIVTHADAWRLLAKVKAIAPAMRG